MEGEAPNDDAIQGSGMNPYGEVKSLVCRCLPMSADVG